MNRLERLRGGLVVSCQPLPDIADDPMRDPYVQARVAAAAVMGGAVGIRAAGEPDIAAISSSVDVPVIGLVKVGSAGVFITPTAEHALAVARAGADIVAVDATMRERPDGRRFADTVNAVHTHTTASVLADVSTVDEGLAAAEAGADALATTLSGYTPGSPASDQPDIDLLARLAAATDLPVIAEGRYRTPEHIRAAFAAGAHAVVMGNAITSPLWITRHLVPATPSSIRTT
ncbi:MAG TPA: putative N-acetylmannosamine-6-phosphate 2-epimerase [Candidatus Limnocylindrales bacterium]